MNALVGYLTENCCAGGACATECAPAPVTKKAGKRSKAA
jgi:hypothetical protein